MFCQKCGAKIDLADAFCRQCAFALKSEISDSPRGATPARVHKQSSSAWQILGIALLLAVIAVAGSAVWSTTIGRQTKIEAAKRAIGDWESACSTRDLSEIAHYKVLAEKAIGDVGDADEVLRLDTELANKEILLGCQ